MLDYGLDIGLAYSTVTPKCNADQKSGTPGQKTEAGAAQILPVLRQPIQRT